MIPESDDAREEPRRDVLAARRARRAGLGDPTPLQRAEGAEATVRTLEGNLADLRRRLLETEHERERLGQQLAERERELRRVKQREYAEQQLRVEAEEHFTRLRRGHHTELDRLRERLGEARAAAQIAQERGVRAEHERDELAAHLGRVSQSCERLQAGIAALAGVAAELRGTFEHERTAARKRISELERALDRARRAPSSTPAAPSVAMSGSEAATSGGEGATSGGEATTSATEQGDAGRAEMAAALAAAVERLRARASEPSLAATAPAVGPSVVATAAAPAVEPSSAASSAAKTEAPLSGEPQASPTLETPPATAPQPEPQIHLATVAEREIPTVVVVPRLFPGVRRSQPRLAGLGRRLGRALIRWSERSQDSARR